MSAIGSTLRRLELWYFVAVWLALATLFQSRAFNDPGSLWHIVVGDRIRANGFMTTDPFTYTHAGKTWIPQQWGAELAMSWLYSLSEFDGVLLGMCTLLAGCSTMLLARLRASGMGAPLAVAVAVGGGAAAGYHFVARPHLVTIVLTAYSFAWMVDWEAGRISNWRLAALVPLGIVWTNTHGGVLAAIAIFWFLVGCWISAQFSPVQRYLNAPTLTRSRFLALIGIGVAFSLTPLVNPFGLEMIRTWTRIVGSTVLSQVVVEHMPTDWGTPLGLTLIGVLSLYLLLLVGCLPGRIRASWLVPLIWFALTAKGVRHGPLFCVITLVIIAELWPNSRWYRYFRQTGDLLAIEPTWGCSRMRVSWYIPAFLLVVLAGSLQFGRIAIPLVGSGWAKLDPQQIPYPLAETLRAKIAEHGPRVVNDANLGGFIVFFARDANIYMDDRFELYGDAWTQAYADSAFETPQDIAVWAEKYRASVAVVARGKKVAKFDAWLESAPGWRLVQACETGAIYERVPPDR